MNNIRKIINERLENARNELKDCVSDYSSGFLKGQINAYQDGLLLIDYNNSQLGIMSSQELTDYANTPAPRTEVDILKDFEKLGWIVSRNDEDYFTLRLKGNPTCAIWIDKLTKEYSMSCCLDMQEHKLLNELFICWGWL